MPILISAAENQADGQVWPFDGFLQKSIDGQALARLIGSRTGSQAACGEDGTSVSFTPVRTHPVGHEPPVVNVDFVWVRWHSTPTVGALARANETLRVGARDANVEALTRG